MFASNNFDTEASQYQLFQSPTRKQLSAMFSSALLFWKRLFFCTISRMFIASLLEPTLPFEAEVIRLIFYADSKSMFVSWGVAAEPHVRHTAQRQQLLLFCVTQTLLFKHMKAMIQPLLYQIQLITLWHDFEVCKETHPDWVETEKWITWQPT